MASELTVPRMDFSTLGDLGNVYREAQARRSLADLTTTANADGKIDFNKASLQLLAAGDKAGALSLAQLGMNQAQQFYSRDRDSVNDQWRRQEAQRAQGNSDRAASLQEKALAMRDTPAGFATAPGGLQPIPGGPADPKYLAEKDAASGKNNFPAVVEQRRRAAVANGLDPSSPGYQSFVLTGKMPREDAQPLTATDKKAILEADEAISTTKNAIDGLTQAKRLSRQAFAGPGAEWRGYAASFLGDSSELGKGGASTTELNNLITTNALSQLKAVFGGMPTEGERKILLEVQGSVNLPDNVRQKIYDRAIEMAQRRLQFNQQRADALRGGTFYKSGGAPQTQSQPDAASAPKLGEVQDGYRFKGGDPSDPTNWIKVK